MECFKLTQVEWVNGAWTFEPTRLVYKADEVALVRDWARGDARLDFRP